MAQVELVAVKVNSAPSPVTGFALSKSTPAAITPVDSLGNQVVAASQALQTTHTPSYVQQVGFATGTAVTSTVVFANGGAANIPVGSCLILSVGFSATAPVINSIVDSVGNVWQRLVAMPGSNLNAELWGTITTKFILASSYSATVTFSVSSTFSIDLEQYTGVSGFGLVSIAQGSSTRPTTSSIPIQDSNNFVVMAYVVNSGGIPIIGTPSTGTLRDIVNNSGLQLAFDDNTAAIAGTQVSNIGSLTLTNAWSACSVELRTTSGPGTSSSNIGWNINAPSIVPQASLTPKYVNSTAAQNLKSSAGSLYGAWLVNLATSTATTANLTMYVHFFDTSNATLSTANWLFALPIASPGVINIIGAGSGAGLNLPPGALALANFVNGISIVINTTSTSNTTAAGTAPTGVFWIE